MADFTVTIDLEGMRKRLLALGTRPLTDTMLAVVRLTLQHWLRSTVEKISGPYLRVPSGSARRSIIADVAAPAGDGVVGRFGSPLRYVRAHELGFRGKVKVRAHQRFMKLPTRRGATQVTVRAHQRVMNLRARRFMRDSIAEDLPGLPARTRRALILLARNGSAPSLSEIA